MSSKYSTETEKYKKLNQKKITKINLDIDSSSSSSSPSSQLKQKKHKTSSMSSHNIQQKENNISKKISLFSDSDENENEKKLINNKNDKNIENEEDLAYGFEKALKKKQFDGKKGSLLLKLQNSYVNDPRFTLDSKFKNDIEYKKLPESMKDKNKRHTDLFNYDENSLEADDVDIELEKKQNLSILAELLPNSAFLDRKVINKPINKLIQKRFDPKLNLGVAAVAPIKVEKKIKKDEKNLVKLETGVKVFTDKDEIELYNNYYNNQGKHVKELKKSVKEKLISDAVNKINDEMNQEIKVNYDSWKKGIFEKVDNNFSLFNNINEKDENKKTKNINILGVGEENKEENKEESKEESKEENKEESKEKKYEQKELLRKKKKREKEKLRKKEKERIRKAKKQHKKEKIKRKIEKDDKNFESNLKEAFGEEKVNNYLKYIDMIKEKKNKLKNK